MRLHAGTCASTSILDDRKYDYLFTVEDVNRLVLQGTPFREAYKEVGMAVQRAHTPTREVHHTHEGSIGNPPPKSGRRWNAC